MTNIVFEDPTDATSRARIALIGPPGAGKTYTGLTLAAALGERVAVLDTEHGSAGKYRRRFRFKHSVLVDFDPRNYIAGVRAAERAGFDVLMIDSLSHAWAGKGGALEMVDKAAKRSSSNNKFMAWGGVTPLYNEMVETILAADLHIVVTMRSKTEYLVEQGKNGKSTVNKVGTAPVMRDGVEYEFDVVADLTTGLDMVITKTRCPELHDAVINRPTGRVAETVLAWLNDGEPEQPTTTNEPAEDPGEPAMAPPSAEDDAEQGGGDWFAELVAEIGPDATESRAHAALIKHADFQDLRVKDWRSVLAGYDDDRARQVTDVLLAKFREAA